MKLSTIGDLIKYYRLDANLLQKDIAIKANIDISTIKRYENNKVEVSLEILNKIGKAIGISPHLLYDDYFNFISSNYDKTIISIRKKLNLNQKDFGFLMGVHRKTIARWENKKSYPSRENFKLLMKYF